MFHVYIDDITTSAALSDTVTCSYLQNITRPEKKLESGHNGAEKQTGTHDSMCIQELSEDNDVFPPPII